MIKLFWEELILSNLIKSKINITKSKTNKTIKIIVTYIINYLTIQIGMPEIKAELELEYMLFLTQKLVFSINFFTYSNSQFLNEFLIFPLSAVIFPDFTSSC